MKLNSTYIAEVLDRSGSMGIIADKTRDGHNEFLRGQKTLPGECKYMLARFDHEYELLYDGSLAEAPELTPLNYTPRGGTALLDAIGDTIKGLGQKLDGMPESQRPERVVFVIITDGEENSSRRYTRDQIFAMIDHQRSAYQWHFLFLGAGQDAIAEAAKIGIPMKYAANFTASNVGGTYKTMSNKVGVTRAMSGAGGQSVSAAMAFTPEERQEMEEEGEKK